ncbi:hypothetical protein [Niabella hirudinis]|uniref:hypothetical protein n=1 Tax=Niabella hirudinis TaxID=1285929 RepID=UPI003EBAC9E6
MRKVLFILSVACCIFCGVSCTGNEDNKSEYIYKQSKERSYFDNPEHLPENNVTEEENNSESEDEFNAEEDIYPDGKYEAYIYYYNPSTGTQSTYTLDVKVRNDKVIEIEFNNGGWLDDTHFDPPRLRNGKAEIITDEDYEYAVELLRFKY